MADRLDADVADLEWAFFSGLFAGVALGGIAALIGFGLAVWR